MYYTDNTKNKRTTPLTTVGLYSAAVGKVTRSFHPSRVFANNEIAEDQIDPFVPDLLPSGRGFTYNITKLVASRLDRGTSILLYITDAYLPTCSLKVRLMRLHP
jgi:hypothetical protein